jgi:hypothetical protein
MLSLSLSLSHTHTHTHTHSPHTFTHTHTYTHSYTFTHTHTHTLSPFVTQSVKKIFSPILKTHTHTLSLSLSLSLSHWSFSLSPLTADFLRHHYLFLSFHFYRSLLSFKRKPGNNPIKLFRATLQNIL